MHPSIRGLAAWAAMLSLVAGSWLSLGAGSSAPDADGICGPVLVLGRTVRHFEAAHAAPSPEHCAFCHWRHTMSSAAASAIVAVATPADLGVSVAKQPRGGPALVETGSPAPRGPPAVS